MLTPRSIGVAIFCGHRQINLDMIGIIEKVYDTVRSLEPGQNSLFSNVGYEYAHDLFTCILKPTEVDIHTQPMKHSLVSMVQQCSHRLCSDPRDAIYALLNLSLPIDIEPDYERPVEHLYMMATKTLINCEQNLNIFSTPCALVQSEKYGCLPYIELPTWVPHFESILDTTEICSFYLDYGRQQYCAGGISKSHKGPFSTGDLRILPVDGGFYRRSKKQDR